jgi:hypothetical protein
MSASATFAQSTRAAPSNWHTGLASPGGDVRVRSSRAWRWGRVVRVDAAVYPDAEEGLGLDGLDRAADVRAGVLPPGDGVSLVGAQDVEPGGGGVPSGGTSQNAEGLPADVLGSSPPAGGLGGVSRFQRPPCGWFGIRSRSMHAAGL